MIQSIAPPEHVDRAVLAVIRALGSPDEDVLGEAASLFLGEIPGRLWGLVDAINADGADSVADVRSLFAEWPLGREASRMANLRLALEWAARWPALDRAAEHIAELAAVFETTRLALQYQLGEDMSGCLRSS